MGIPQIIAMKGHPCTGKSLLAKSMAENFKCHLISQDDVRDSIANLLEPVQPSAHKTLGQYLHDQSFEATCQITTHQLERKWAPCIIDSSLSRRADLDRLLLVSSQTRGRLVVVECKPLDMFEWQKRVEQRQQNSWYKPSKWEDIQEMLLHWEDYDTGPVSKVVVNTTDHVTAGPLHMPLSRLAGSTGYHCIDYHDWMDKLAKGFIEENGVCEVNVPRRQDIEARDEGIRLFHQHQLALSLEGRDGEICKGCSQPILKGAPCYKCSYCGLVSLHKYCTELPDKREFRPQDSPSFVREIEHDQYCFRHVVKCDLCETNDHEQDWEDCVQCLHESYIRSAELPSVLIHPAHQHPLHIRMVPVAYSSEFKCHACGDPGKHIRYYCSECRLDFHLSCSLLPHTWKQEHHRHNLTISPLPEEEESDEEFVCNACETFVMSFDIQE